MKKLILGAFAIGGLFMTSCKKDYTCTCNTLGVETKNPIKDASKKEAQDTCDKMNESAKIVNGSCKL
jgi:hypothetical protein